MTRTLSSKHAIVTGASKGIGAEIARTLASAGAAVTVNYSSDQAGADKVVADIAAGGCKASSKPISALRMDRKSSWPQRQTFGPIDILVNNAGSYEFAPLDQITPDHFHKQFNLNVLGLLLTTQEAVRHFRPEGGGVVNISSGVSTMLPPNSAGLFRHQGIGGCDHSGARQGAGGAPHPRQRRQSRHDRHRRRQGCRHRPGRHARRD